MSAVPHRRQAAPEHGFAVVWVLLVCCLLLAILLVLLGLFGSETKRTQGDSHVALTESLIDSAVQEVEGKLMTGFSAAAPTGDGVTQAHVTASPGLLEVLNYVHPLNRGAAIGAAAFAAGADSPFRNPFAETYDGALANPRWIPLFSRQYFAPALPQLTVFQSKTSDPNPDFNPAAAFNINTPRNPFHPGFCYLSGVGGDPAGVRYERDASGNWAGVGTHDQFALGPGEGSAERPVWVQWIPVLQDPAAPPSASNRMIGRYAYWVDVENTKLNLETSTRPLREQEVYARFLGESDATAQAGSRGYFTQSASNPFRALRVNAEGPVPHWDLQARHSIDGQPGPGFSAVVAHDVREAWLGWRNGGPPAVADSSLVDWDYFAGWRPTGAAEQMGLDHVLSEHARRVVEKRTSPFVAPEEAYTLLDPKLGAGSSGGADSRVALMRELVTSAATVWGYEEERDPLGRPLIDLPKFQRAITTGGAVKLDAIRASPLWERLHDARYFNALYPAAFPTGGQSRSFVQALSRFAGDGTDKLENGEAAALQMLANVGEYAQPPETPPLIDRDLGIVGARSMPYVAEIATRARSAWWTLPADVRADPTKRFDANGAAKDGGHPLTWYASHLVIDLAVACLNPDPFSTQVFDGELDLDASWLNPPADSQLETAPLVAPLHGRFTISPQAAKEPKLARVVGDTVYFRLGVIPASALADPAFASAFRIKGWKIKSNGAVWHETPVRQPGGGPPREWWAMAQSGENAGSPWDVRSLSAYQTDAANYGYRSIGWFSRPALDSLMPDALFVAGLDASATPTPAQLARLATWMQWTPSTAMVERVFSIDPTLGHRTGDSGLTGIFGRGHFYGALGHTWRHLAQRPAYLAALPGQTMPQIIEWKLPHAEYALSPRITTSVPGHTLNGVFLTAGNLSASYQTAVATVGDPIGGKYFSQNWFYPTQLQTTVTAAPDSLTALFLVPSVEGAFPIGDFHLDAILDGNIQLTASASGRLLKDADLESSTVVPDKGDLTALPDPKKSSRSILCSAPAGRLMTSVGELGLCHSGFPNRPILLGPEEGRTDLQLNSPRFGPPMRLLLDLFCPGVFVDPQTGTAVSEPVWQSASGPSASPANPRRGLWNVNGAIAHDQYLALREGGTPDDWNIRTAVDPGRLPVHAAWIPNAVGSSRRALGTEDFHGKELADLFTATPGHLLDRNLSPFPVLDRPWRMWLNLLGGDFSPMRSTGGQLWGLNNALLQYFGPGAFTWCPGNGTGARYPMYATPWVDFDPTSTIGRGKLLAFGSDARNDLDNGFDGYLTGRFAADQNLAALAPGKNTFLPARQVTRLSLFPMRHFLSDLCLDYQLKGEFYYLKTPLNPRESSSALPTDGVSGKAMEGDGFPGGQHAAGVYVQAPLALITNQASTSANAFTIHVVAQTLRDIGKPRDGVAKSGYGFSDPDDEVQAERWARIVVVKIPSASTVAEAPRLRIVHADYSDR